MPHLRLSYFTLALGSALLAASACASAQNKPISLHPPGMETAPAPVTPPTAPTPQPAVPSNSSTDRTTYGTGGSATTPNVGTSSSANVGHSVAEPVHGRLKTSVRNGRAVAMKPLAKKPPEPIVDADGLQLYDPDGKPMFAPTVFQLRDRKGLPVFDPDGNPVFQTPDNLGYDERGHAIKPPKEPKVPPPPKGPVVIEHGSLEINGIVGKVRLNYTINDMHYLYMYSPEIGVTIVSDQPFRGAKLQPNAFRGKTLVVRVDGKLITLSSDQILLGKKPRAAFVAVDRSFTLPSKFPVFGYGDTAHAPYVWPGSHKDDSYVSADAPKVIEGLKPKLDDSAMTAAPAPAASDSSKSSPTH